MKNVNWSERLGKNSPLYHQMRSPLRLHLLRTFQEDPARVFDAANLSRTSGILVRDVLACLAPMVEDQIIEEVPIPNGLGYRLRNAGEGGLLPAIEMVLKDNSRAIEQYATVREKFFSNMIGVDEKMKIVFEMIRTIARTDATVLIIGETGTGKELVASAIHEFSHRASQPFHTVNCGTLPEDQFESEMFGTEDESPSAERPRRAGRFEQAGKGSLFLDEIGELSLANQIKLLRVLEARGFSRLGGTELIATDFRLIAATHHAMDQKIRNGEFRDDLYYRINVFPIHLPSLRERKDDIPILAMDFLQQYGKENHDDPWAKTFADDALNRMQTYSWPGNVRELENFVNRIALLTPPGRIEVQEVEKLLEPQRKRATRSEMQGLNLQEVERYHIQRVLRIAQWNIKKASELLGISRVTLYKKIKQFDLRKPEEITG